ncbi:hypothetical protein HHI36_021121 [Cryptolaemus montrouzieri]|uniref:Uncharacterized protein n=1 Tax=Cryptolaemus montrouzieri TaxID=559131 RepID=A0ABD2MVY4_9CUCU
MKRKGDIIRRPNGPRGQTRRMNEGQYKPLYRYEDSIDTVPCQRLIAIKLDLNSTLADPPATAAVLPISASITFKQLEEQALIPQPPSLLAGFSSKSSTKKSRKSESTDSAEFRITFCVRLKHPRHWRLPIRALAGLRSRRKSKVNFYDVFTDSPYLGRLGNKSTDRDTHKNEKFAARCYVSDFVIGHARPTRSKVPEGNREKRRTR